MFVSPVMETVSPNFLAVLVAAVSPLKVKPVLSTAAFAATPLAMSVLVAVERSTSYAVLLFASFVPLVTVNAPAVDVTLDESASTV